MKQTIFSYINILNMHAACVPRYGNSEACLPSLTCPQLFASCFDVPGDRLRFFSGAVWEATGVGSLIEGPLQFHGAIFHWCGGILGRGACMRITLWAFFIVTPFFFFSPFFSSRDFIIIAIFLYNSRLKVAFFKEKNITLLTRSLFHTVKMKRIVILDWKPMCSNQSNLFISPYFNK